MSLVSSDFSDRGIDEAAHSATLLALLSGAPSTVCKILARHEVKPHKVRYYLERRDEAFETKMADVLYVYREVALLRESGQAEPHVVIISGACPRA